MRTYLIRTGVLMTIYAGLNIAAITGAFDPLPVASAYLVGLAVSLPIAGHIWAAVDYIDKADEYISALLAKRFILSAGGAIAIFSGWGFLESYASTAHAPGWLIYPLFWLLFGITNSFRPHLQK